jgi:uncharacterized membrane protein YgaE (UPF0421/DUF939 family)
MVTIKERVRWLKRNNQAIKPTLKDSVKDVLFRVIPAFLGTAFASGVVSTVLFYLAFNLSYGKSLIITI